MRRLLALAFIVTIGIVAAAQSRQAPAGTAHIGNAFRFNEVRPGVYHAVGTGNLAVVGNSSFIVNDDDVTVVDDHVSPAAAWVLLEEIKRATDKPVTTVINTHFHYDHASGNQIFDQRVVSIIGHEFTRQMLLGDPLAMPLYRGYVTGLPGQLDTLRRRLEAETDAAKQAALRNQIAVAESNRAAQAELKPTPPNVTLTDRMTLYRGTREIQIRHLGRAHTAGDVVVFLPREKVVITGDFLTAGLSNLSDSFPEEWVASLDELKTLDFGTVLPGHGEAFTDKAKIGYWQDYLRDVWTEVGRLKQQGLTAEEASTRADLTKHRAHLPVNAPGVPLVGVQRIYDLIDGRVQR